MKDMTSALKELLSQRENFELLLRLYELLGTCGDCKVNYYSQDDVKNMWCNEDMEVYREEVGGTLPETWEEWCKFFGDLPTDQDYYKEDFSCGWSAMSEDECAEDILQFVDCVVEDYLRREAVEMGILTAEELQEIETVIDKKLKERVVK